MPALSAITTALLYPFTLFFQMVARFPWPTIIIGTALSIGALALHDTVIAANLVMFVSIVLIWVDEHTHQRAADIGAVAGD